MAPAAQVNARIETWNRLQQSRPASTPRVVAPASKSGLGGGTIVWIALLVIGSLARLGEHAGNAPASPARLRLDTSGDAAEQQRIDQDLDRRQRQAEAMLQGILDGGATAKAGSAPAPMPAPAAAPASSPLDMGATFEQQSAGR
jgi:hypothetical protein